MGSSGQAADAGGILRFPGVEPEFQDAVFAAHLLVVPVVIAVIEFGEVGMTLDKPRLWFCDHPVGFWHEDLLHDSGLVAKPSIKFEAHTGTWNAEAVVDTLPYGVE